MQELSERQQALIDLMSMPDPPDLPQRRYRLTYAGRFDRHAVIRPKLVTAWLVHRDMMLMGEIPGVRVRRWPEWVQFVVQGENRESSRAG